jgi:hypothetical protein
MQSRTPDRRPTRSRWAHCNTPDALRRRRAAADARREALAAQLPPIDTGPPPLSAWQTVQVLDAHGQVMRQLVLRVPTAGRCDQHAAELDGQRLGLLTATAVGRLVAGWVCKRESAALQADLRRHA